MIVRFITCRIKSGTHAEFEAATVENHKNSIAEQGVLRFDVLKDSSSDDTYYLYEMYRDEDATRVHKTTDHYKTWRDRVGPLMAESRTSIVCSALAPAAGDLVD